MQLSPGYAKMALLQVETARERETMTEPHANSRTGIKSLTFLTLENCSFPPAEDTLLENFFTLNYCARLPISSTRGVLRISWFK